MDLTDYQRIKTCVNDVRFGVINIYMHASRNDDLILEKTKTAASPEDFEFGHLQAESRMGLQHPSLLRMFSASGDSALRQTRVFFRYPNEDLYDRQNALTNSSEIIKFLMNMLEVLAYLQSRGYVHGDLRPEYIFYDADQQVYVLSDRLGDSRSLCAVQQSSLIYDDKHVFMSPGLFEQLSWGRMHARHDPFKSEVFSLGMVLMSMYIDFNDMSCCYDRVNRRFDVEHLHSILDDMNTYFFVGKIERLISEFVYSSMLQPDERKRMSPKQCLDRLKSEVIPSMLAELEHVDSDGQSALMFSTVSSGANKPALEQSGSWHEHQAGEDEQERPGPENRELEHLNELLKKENDREYESIMKEKNDAETGNEHAEGADKREKDTQGADEAESREVKELNDIFKLNEHSLNRYLRQVQSTSKKPPHPRHPRPPKQPRLTFKYISTDEPAQPIASNRSLKESSLSMAQARQFPKTKSRPLEGVTEGRVSNAESVRIRSALLRSKRGSNGEQRGRDLLREFRRMQRRGLQRVFRDNVASSLSQHVSEYLSGEEFLISIDRTALGRVLKGGQSEARRTGTNASHASNSLNFGSDGRHGSVFEYFSYGMAKTGANNGPAKAFKTSEFGKAENCMGRFGDAEERRLKSLTECPKPEMEMSMAKGGTAEDRVSDDLDGNEGFWEYEQSRSHSGDDVKKGEPERGGQGAEWEGRIDWLPRDLLADEEDKSEEARRREELRAIVKSNQEYLKTLVYFNMITRHIKRCETSSSLVLSGFQFSRDSITFRNSVNPGEGGDKDLRGGRKGSDEARRSRLGSGNEDREEASTETVEKGGRKGSVEVDKEQAGEKGWAKGSGEDEDEEKGEQTLDIQIEQYYDAEGEEGQFWFERKETRQKKNRLKQKLMSQKKRAKSQKMDKKVSVQSKWTKQRRGTAKRPSRPEINPFRSQMQARAKPNEKKEDEEDMYRSTSPNSASNSARNSEGERRTGKSKRRLMATLMSETAPEETALKVGAGQGTCTEMACGSEGEDQELHEKKAEEVEVEGKDSGKCGMQKNENKRTERKKVKKVQRDRVNREQGVRIRSERGGKRSQMGSEREVEIKAEKKGKRRHLKSRKMLNVETMARIRESRTDTGLGTERGSPQTSGVESQGPKTRRNVHKKSGSGDQGTSESNVRGNTTLWVAQDAAPRNGKWGSRGED